MSDTPLTFIRVTDRSLRTFQDATNATAEALGLPDDDPLTEDEWAELHAAYWAKADAAEGEVEMSEADVVASLRERLDSLDDDH